LNEANRTMMVHLGWGSASDSSFVGADYTKDWVKFYDDKSWLGQFSSAHPQMDGVFYYDKWA